MLTVQTLTSKSDLAAIAFDWNHLAGGVPFRRWEWCSTWWESYGQSDDLCVVILRDDSECVGIAPFYIANQEPLGRVLRIMGDGEACADYLSILCLPENAKRVGHALGEWFQQHPSDLSDGSSSAIPRWDMMDFDGLDGECETLKNFLESMEQHGFGVRLSTKVNTWRLPLAGTIENGAMETYLASISKPNRRKIRAALKRFKANEFQVNVASETDFESLWDQLIDLHQRRRNSLGDPGCFASCTFSDFLHQTARKFLAARELDLISVSVNDWPVATELCFRGGPTTFAYQLGINPDALKENPGWLVNAAAIHRAIEVGQTSIDWCRGDEEYKRRLGATPKPCLQCRVIPPKFRSQLWDAALVGQSTVKEWLKTGLHAAGIRQ